MNVQVFQSLLVGSQSETLISCRICGLHLRLRLFPRFGFYDYSYLINYAGNERLVSFSPEKEHRRHKWLCLQRKTAMKC